MKRIKRLMSVLLVCCMLAPVTANAAAVPLEGNDAQSSFTQSELEGISSSLKVPESLDAEITQSEPFIGRPVSGGWYKSPLPIREKR